MDIITLVYLLWRLKYNMRQENNEGMGVPSIVYLCPVLGTNKIGEI
jgi:hypothetical protein